ncbi:phosphatase PAP2 family protein [Catenulispora subtropica]|uniref:Phosphatidic acid phosphatase type 2/haloperoxidase domain-containing protein n=1 Tax=Catenulispora subtropica TaxID=450798 RepID=A0ABN2SW41_9ACTN
MTDMHTAASASGPAGPGDASGTVSGDAPDDTSGIRSAPVPAAAGPGNQPSGRRHALRQPEVWIPLALLGAFLMLWALVLARPTFVTSFDLALRNRVQDAAHADVDGARRWPLIKDVADLGGGVAVGGVPVRIQLAMAMLGGVALAAAALRRSWRPLAAAAAGYAALGLVLFLKAIGDRPGPSMAGQSLTDGLGYFPSGHTGTTMLGYGTSALILAFVFTARWMRAVIALAMTSLALAVGFSLVWMDYHWLSDVLGSYALGGSALFVVARILGFRISGSTART